MFYLIAVSLSLGLIGLAALTKNIRVILRPTPIPTKPRSYEEDKPLPSHDDPCRSENGKNVKIYLPRCSDDVCECGMHGRMNFGPADAWAEH
ncbi:MAG: hypothetical protein AAB972_00715 [Patescibacteria group bacterium]